MTEPAPAAPLTATAHVDESLLTYTHVIYGLHALAVLIGLTTMHTIVFSFLWSLPSIIAVIMNYARRSATYGTYLESHFRWQIRTFWYALLWFVVLWFVALASIPLMVVLIGFGTVVLSFIGFVALGVWIAYRVARGWLALKDHRPMYV
jgi:uncharacterized membrane protein